MKNTFATDVDQGLSAVQKTLPSRYFYDKKGDDLFVKIMKMPESFLKKLHDQLYDVKVEW